jgi:hypothetical protein
MFQLSLRCEKFAAARHHSVIGNQLLFANNRNRVRCVVLCLSQDGACTDSFENFRENSLKGDLSNDGGINLFRIYSYSSLGDEHKTVNPFGKKIAENYEQVRSQVSMLPVSDQGVSGSRT